MNDFNTDTEQELAVATKALTQVDRLLVRHLMGELSAEETIAKITTVVGNWTDPVDVR